jgi:hypothetical protein
MQYLVLVQQGDAREGLQVTEQNLNKVNLSTAIVTCSLQSEKIAYANHLLDFSLAS